VNIESIDGAAVAKTAIDKCLRWKEPKRLDPGKYTVVLEPTATGDLVQMMGFGMQARAAEEGRSFLSKKGGGTLAGEKLFPEFITLRRTLSTSCTRRCRGAVGADSVSAAAVAAGGRPARRAHDLDRKRRGEEPVLRSLLGRQSRQAADAFSPIAWCWKAAARALPI
jgi:hypothetical protein